MTKEMYNQSILQAGMSATFDVLNRPKNLAKPPMTDDIGELYQRADCEMRELWEEIYDYYGYGNSDWAKTRAEAGDAIAYLCALIYECDRRLTDEVTRRG